MIKDRLTYGRKTPWQASNRERKRGSDLTRTLRGMPAPGWVMENWPGSATILAVRDRWLIENSWHWPRDTQLREDAHRYRGYNGVQITATLRRLAMNALRLNGFWSITEGLASLSRDIRVC